MGCSRWPETRRGDGDARIGAEWVILNPAEGPRTMIQGDQVWKYRATGLGVLVGAMLGLAASFPLGTEPGLTAGIVAGAGLVIGSVIDSRRNR